MKLLLANRSHADRVTRLRTEAYRTATGSSLRSFDFLHWNGVDDRACVLCLENEAGELVSTVRAIKMDQLIDLEAICDAVIPSPPALPTLYFDKLTTLPAYRGPKLSMVFRVLLLQAALAADIASFSFTINETASRIPMLKQMGYQFTNADLSHRQANHAFDNSVGVLIADLPRSRFAAAIAEGSESLPWPLESLTKEGALATDLLGSLQKSWSGSLVNA